MNQRVLLIVRSVAGIVVLIVLVSVVLRWWGQYRDMASEARSATEIGSPAQKAAEAEAAPKTQDADKPATADETAQEPADETPEATQDQQTLEITTQGLNLRTEPDRGSASVRGLNRGEVVTLLAEQNGWYQVRDAQGAVGWISSNSSYSKRR